VLDQRHCLLRESQTLSERQLTAGTKERSAVIYTIVGSIVAAIVVIVAIVATVVFTNRDSGSKTVVGRPPLQRPRLTHHRPLPLRGPAAPFAAPANWRH